MKIRPIRPKSLTLKDIRKQKRLNHTERQTLNNFKTVVTPESEMTALREKIQKRALELYKKFNS